jgi:RsiW-degrading membrane proteinase PrsW (M82 family)
MKNYYILRNNLKHGPYDLSVLKNYVELGQILVQDKTIDSLGNFSCVKDILSENKIKFSIKSNGSIYKQIKSFGVQLLLPKDSFSFKTLKSDKKLLLIALVGLAPAYLIKFTGATTFTFYAIALYFSIIWGLFYYSVFNTPQVSQKKAIYLFFITQLITLIAVFILRVPDFHPLYRLTTSNHSYLENLLGYILGVGVFEELLKLLPVYIMIKRSKEPLIPQTVVFYGLISGIGFGVFEGVVYQTTLNSTLDYNTSFFMNIARLTSLPFLHSIWSGISAYFISFAVLYPGNRRSLLLLSILIPSCLHGFYDTLGWSIGGLFVAYFSVTLLVIYLKNAKNFQNKIIK